MGMGPDLGGQSGKNAGEWGGSLVDFAACIFQQATQDIQQLRLGLDSTCYEAEEGIRFVLEEGGCFGFREVRIRSHPLGGRGSSAGRATD
jgi:hypothetical protein